MKKDYVSTESLDAASDFSDIITSAASMSLKRPNLKNLVNKNLKDKKSSKNLKWYDVSLQKARLVLMNKEKLFKKFSNDPYVRSSFYKTLKEFRKLRKHKFRQYRQDILNKLDSMRENNPSLYWKLLDELKNTDKMKSKIETVPSSE